MSVNNSIKVFGNKATDSVTQEFEQLDKLGVLMPKRFSDLSVKERKGVLSAVLLIMKKRYNERKSMSR